MDREPASTTAWRQRLGRAGVWVSAGALDDDPPAFADLVERLGYGALWLGGGNPEPSDFSRIEALLSATERLVVATGVVNIWAWQAEALGAQSARLWAAFPDRFVLGLGVSHAPLVEQLGRRYERPYSAMVRSLDVLDRMAAESPPRVLAALGPRMLRLSAARAAGAHPYLTTPEHTRIARGELGSAALLAPEQALVLVDDPAAARRIGRTYLERYLRLPNYTTNLQRIGWSAEDIEQGGSDALVDALVVHGKAQELSAAVEAHIDAGADHVCVQALAGGGAVDWRALEVLAPYLTAE